MPTDSDHTTLPSSVQILFQWNNVVYPVEFGPKNQAHLPVYDVFLGFLACCLAPDGQLSPPTVDLASSIYFQTAGKLISAAKSQYTVSQWIELAKPQAFCTVLVLSRLLGGKGGFGALLRGQKGARRKVTNFDSCRDLSGRRLRVAQAMDRLNQHLDKKKKEAELVAALGSTAVLTEAQKEAEAIKLAHDLRKLNKAYTSGLTSMQNKIKAVTARVKDTALPSSECSTSETVSFSKVEGPLRSAKFDSRFVANLYDESSESDAEIPSSSSTLHSASAPASQAETT